MAVADDFVERYTANSIGLENIVYGYFDSHGPLRAVRELRPVNPQRLLDIGGEMEGAFSVETGWRKQGNGSDLLRLIIRAARTRCCTTLYLSFLTGNVPMRKLALKYGAEIEADLSESSAFIHPSFPTPTTMMEKSFNDARSFAIAVFNLQHHRFQERW